MYEEPSRRSLLKSGMMAVTAAALPTLAAGEVPSTGDIEKELGHPLPEEAKKLLKAALDNNANNANERLKTKLPDCSEPCFGYRVTPVSAK